VLWIVAVWFIFAHPYFIKGLVPFPSRYLVDFFSPWNNFFGHPVKNNAMPDVISQIYPWKKIAIDSWKSGQIPFWNPYQFAGNPLLANYQSAVFSPFNIFFFIFPFIDAWSILVLLQPLLAAFFMYIFMRELKISKFGALLSGISFMFAGFLTVWMAYGTLAYAILFLPLLLFGIERYFNKQDKLSSFIIVASLPLSFFSGHFQTSLYFLLTGVLYILFKFTQKKNIKLLLNSYFLLLTGIILSLPQLIPSVQFYQQSVRSGLFQKGEAIPWNYLITVIAPDFFGNPVTRNDWFGHYAEWASFAGVIPLMLALYLIINRKKYSGRGSLIIYFFAGVAVLSFLLAFQTPLLDLLIKLKLPVLSTSAASRIIVLFSFSIAVLAGIGLDHVKQSKSLSVKTAVVYLSLWIATAGIVWALLLSGNLLFVKDVDVEKLSVAKHNFILPTFMVLAGCAFLLSGFIVNRLVKKAKLRRNLLRITYYVLLITISFDLLRFATKWMPFDEREFVYPKARSLEYLQQNAGNYRVFGNFGNEAQAPFGLYGIEGYDPLYIKRYGELAVAASSAADGRIQKPTRSVVLFDKNSIYSRKLLDLLGVRYILHSKGDGKESWAFPFWRYPESFVQTPVWSDEKYEIYKNKRAYPRAFLVYKYKVASSDQNIIDLVFNKDTDLSKTVILEEQPKIENLTIEQLSNEAMKNSVQITKYTPNVVEIKVQSSHPGLLFLSDNYYPGWNVYVNGKKTKIYRANYSFRAVEVPKGKSTVIFTYENWYF
jgi:hypothetical protein